MRGFYSTIVPFYLIYSTVIEKRGDNNQTVFRLQISTDSIRIHYLTGSDSVQSINFGENYIPTHTWSHIAVQV